LEAIETGLRQGAAIVAWGIDLIMLGVIVLGSIRAVMAVIRCLSKGEGLAPNIRAIWLHYASWILLALEFALAADIIDTVVAPSWQEIGQLGAIAGIRIALGYFLGRDIGEYREIKPESP
jgi:uncharacterized membrane protein